MSYTRLNPLPWVNWSQWHTNTSSDTDPGEWDDWGFTGFPGDGSPHGMRAFDYGGAKLLATTRQQLLMDLMPCSLRWRTWIPDVDEDGFLRCTMVVRLDRLGPNGEKNYDNATALYSEYDFFTGRNTTTIPTPGGRFKFEVVGQDPVDGQYHDYEFLDLLPNLYAHWQGYKPDSFSQPIDLADYYIRYIAPTIEARNGGARLYVADMEVFAGDLARISLNSDPITVPFLVDGVEVQAGTTIQKPVNSTVNVIAPEEVEV